MIIRQLVLSAIQKLITREQKINYTNGVQETEPAKKNSAVETEQATVFDIAVPEYINTTEYNEGIGHANLN